MGIYLGGTLNCFKKEVVMGYDFTPSTLYSVKRRGIKKL